MKTQSKFEHSLQSIHSDVKVPQNLAERIKARIHAYAALLERKLILRSGGLALLALILSFYGLAGLLSNVVESEFSFYMSSMLSEPSLLLNSTGLRAFLERIPVVSILILTAGLVLFGFNLKQLIRLQPHVKHHEQTV